MSPVSGYLTAEETDAAIDGVSGGDPSAAWPVGSVFIAVVSTNPATLLGFGTWSAFAAGRVLVGIDSGDTDFDVVEETGGNKTCTISESNLPTHSHTLAVKSADVADKGSVYDGVVASGENTATTNEVGASEAFSLLQPYIVVYMWKRTA